MLFPGMTPAGILDGAAFSGIAGARDKARKRLPVAVKYLRASNIRPIRIHFRRLRAPGRVCHQPDLPGHSGQP